MDIIIDYREQSLFDKLSEISLPSEIRIQKENLTLGDIVLRKGEETILIIERKSITDLLASIKDGRYEEQSYRLIHASGIPRHNILYLIEGYMHVQSPQNQKLVYSCITSLNSIKGFSVMRTGTVNETAMMISCMADKLSRDFQKGKTLFHSTVESVTDEPTESYSTVVKKIKKDNIDKHNVSEIMLCSIPKIGTKVAKAILQGGTIYDLIHKLAENPNALDGLMVEDNSGKMRKIARTTIETICEYLLSTS